MLVHIAWSLLIASVCALSNTPTVNFNWTQVIKVSPTTTTLQVVANPLLNLKTCPVAHIAWQRLQDLQASYVRYCPWYPYPITGVAEMLPPDVKRNKTYWSYKNMETYLDPFIAAQQGRPVILTLSTNPAWMFDGSWGFPTNPNDVDWDYMDGNNLPNSTDQIARYYGRVMNYLLNGWMIDEAGNNITGGPKYGSAITHFEVLNEPEGCRGNWDAQTYVSIFDAVVAEIRNVADPDHRLKFVGPAMWVHQEWDWIESYLDPATHEPEVRDAMNVMTFHFYAQPSTRDNVIKFSREMFNAADDFITECTNISRIRDRLNPATMLDVNEMGVILPNDNDPDVTAPPMLY
eukprot:PhF_6_TR26237/c0_g2_i1/m.37487